MVIKVPADSHSFRSAEVNSAICPFPFFAGSDQHVIHTVFGLEQERVTEVILVITIRISFQVEGTVLGPCLEIGRSSYHHYLSILVGRRLELITGVEGIIQFVGRVIDRSSCADGSILFVTPSAGNQFAERFVSSTVFGSHPENGMVRSFGGSDGNLAGTSL